MERRRRPLEDAPTAIRRLKQQGDGNMFAFGSASLCSSLISRGAFDEYRIGIAPLLQGVGRPLFGCHRAVQPLTLLESRRLSNGYVILRYGCGEEA